MSIKVSKVMLCSVLPMIKINWLFSFKCNNISVCAYHLQNEEDFYVTNSAMGCLHGLYD